jgi:transposase
VPEEITAAQATRILRSAKPSGPAGRPRRELAAELLEDMRRLDAQIRESRKKLAIAVKASGTSLTGIFGAGPVIAATVIGDVARFSFTASGVAHNGGIR